jgi:hypothetical protein
VRRRDLFALPAALARGRKPPLGGTFLQFWAAHRDWDPARWQLLFSYLAAMRVSDLVVQWCAYDDLDYGPLVDRVLDLSARNSMRVRIGLKHESRWWADVEASPEKALARLAERARASAGQMPAAWRRHKAFLGSYLPEEIDDVHWRSPHLVSAWAGFLKELRQLGKPLAVSGFAHRASAPGELSLWWRNVARQSGIESVFFQDGIGAGKLTLAEWPLYAAALSSGLGKKLRVVVETFQSVSSPGGFRATPAPLDRVLHQCRLAAQFSRHSPLAFSLPEYYTPLGGDEAATLHSAYISQMD